MLFLAEGDPETWASWSGCSRSLVTALRKLERVIRTADVEARGLQDGIARAVAFWPHRARWANRYAAGSFGFRVRSGLARRAALTHASGAPILQAGATFSTPTSRHSRYIICDANAAFAARGGEFGPLAHLSRAEVESVIARERSVYQQSHGIFAFTESLRKSFIDDFDIHPKRVVTTYQGPNLERFPTASDLATPKVDTPMVLFAGRQFNRKGGPTLVRAFAQVRARIPEARLAIVGCTPNLADKPGIDVLGMLPRETEHGLSLKTLYLTADVFCMPTRYEGFGTVFAEAMWHGLPCIGSREYSSEIIDHGRTGWVVDAGDENELADVLIAALEDRERLRAMGSASRERAESLFNWDRVARLVVEHIDATAPTFGSRRNSGVPPVTPRNHGNCGPTEPQP